MPQAKPRRFILHEVTYKDLQAHAPNVAVLPWGATEAHNYHLPHGTDVIEATTIAARAAEIADGRGAKVIVLPCIPFGNNAQQLDQVATIHINTTTAGAILNDVVASLAKQGIDRLVIVNAHGGNDLKALVRDVQAATGTFVAVVNFWQMIPDVVKSTFKEPGDHAGELETSLLLHVCPEWVKVSDAGKGATVPFNTASLKQPGVWTPRSWSRSHPDTGAGDPSAATAEKGRAYFVAVSEAIAKVLVDLSHADRVSLP
jgi:creatinine amidohydrolase